MQHDVVFDSTYSMSKAPFNKFDALTEIHE